MVGFEFHVSGAYAGVPFSKAHDFGYSAVSFRGLEMKFLFSSRHVRFHSGVVVTIISPGAFWKT